MLERFLFIKKNRFICYIYDSYLLFGFNIYYWSWWAFDNLYNMFFLREFKEFKITDIDYNNDVLTGQKGSSVVENFIRNDNVFAFARLGYIEKRVLAYYNLINKKVIKKGFPLELRMLICNNAGFFPGPIASNKDLRLFCEKYIESLKYVDIFGVLYNSNEDVLIKSYASNSIIMDFKCLFFLMNNNPPYTSSLEGKRVLVVHPYANLIKQQYEKRSDLFEDNRILPKMDLIVYEAIQSIGDSRHVENEYKSWIEALNKMCIDIDGLEFDVALVGAGAYGLPLCAHIRKSGRTAIHQGGELQLLFGIKGSRWDQRKNIREYYNNYWVRPGGQLKPKGFDNIEKGCYW